MTLRLLFLIGFQLASGTAAALADRYDCEVKQFNKLDNDGTLLDGRGDSPLASVYKSLVGKTFVVDRSTGFIQGDAWFKTSDFEDITIISNGRDGNSFRTLYVGRPPTSVTLFLYIKETAESERKPFIMVDSSFAELTFSGTCK